MIKKKIVLQYKQMVKRGRRFTFLYGLKGVPMTPPFLLWSAQQKILNLNNKRRDWDRVSLLLLYCQKPMLSGEFHLPHFTTSLLLQQCHCDCHRCKVGWFIRSPPVLAGSGVQEEKPYPCNTRTRLPSSTPQVRNHATDEHYLSFSRNSPKRGSYLLLEAQRRRVLSKYQIEGKGDIELEERNSRPGKRLS